jgi:hypothetical protein
MSWQRWIVAFAWAGVSVGSLWVAGCGTNAVATAEACAGRDLSNICPAGTRPRLDAASTAQCAGAADVRLIRQEGQIAGACTSEGRCAVFCEADPEFRCEYGIQSIGRDAVVCSEAPVAQGCGNGACEPGETPQSCPRDCSGVCTPNTHRCNGNHRQTCNRREEWETVECVDGERCVETGNTTRCVQSDFARQMARSDLPTLPRTEPTRAVQQTQPQPTRAVQQTTRPQQTQTASQSGARVAGFACDATFQCLRLEPGFLPDPVAVPGRSGGPNRYGECSGYFAPASNPDHILHLDREFAYLRIGLIEGGPVGATMLVASLDGNGVYCSQPTSGAPVLQRQFARGAYGVWIGARTAQEQANYTLYASELR